MKHTLAAPRCHPVSTTVVHVVVVLAVAPRGRSVPCRGGSLNGQWGVGCLRGMSSFAAWFDREKVHALERRSLPEFFNNSSPHKTAAVRRLGRCRMAALCGDRAGWPWAGFPFGGHCGVVVPVTLQVYVRYRNFIVDMYRSQPTVYLTATAVRRLW